MHGILANSIVTMFLLLYKINVHNNVDDVIVSLHWAVAVVANG